MKINWFTLIAQIINFLVLMWLLKRYLYNPILNAIDLRENKIVAQLKDAEAKKAEAEKERDEFNKKNETFERQKGELMQKAIVESNEEGRKLKEEARNEANVLKAKLEKNIQDSQENRNLEIAQKIQQEVVAIAKKTLTDLSSASLEEQSVLTFIKRINELKEDEKQKMISTLTSRKNPILVKSAFKLSTKLQTEIQQSINAVLDEESQFQFKIAPELISGIELSANGYKLSWSISEYINSLEKSMNDSAQENIQTTLEKG
tara:strand:- start:20473 stop:21255 length:783 start_codon:yes stop_codon:yes gene_type:complete